LLGVCIVLLLASIGPDAPQARSGDAAGHT